MISLLIDNIYCMFFFKCCCDLIDSVSGLLSGPGRVPVSQTQSESVVRIYFDFLFIMVFIPAGDHVNPEL